MPSLSKFTMDGALVRNVERSNPDRVGRDRLSLVRLRPLPILLCRSAMVCRFVSFCTEAVMRVINHDRLIDDTSHRRMIRSVAEALVIVGRSP
ncbi:hypothetical protein AKI39_21740 [Bordetella sp. H567]|nr:hypothetical protein AKI39_21740 [Bordetella sp. H567]